MICLRDKATNASIISEAKCISLRTLGFWVLSKRQISGSLEGHCCLGLVSK